MATKTKKNDAGKGTNVGGRGRKANIDLKIVRQFAQLFATVSEIAVAVGVAKSTLYLQQKLRPEIREAILEGRRLGRLSVRRRLFEWSAKDPRVAIHMARTYLRDEPTKRVEVNLKGNMRSEVRNGDEGDRLANIAALASVVASDPKLPSEMRPKIAALADAAKPK